MASSLRIGVSDSGFVSATRDEIYEYIASGLKSSFGPSFDTTPESPDGMYIGFAADFGKMLLDIVEEGYYSQDLDAAYGAGLSRLVKLNGLERFVDTHTRVSVFLDGDIGTVVLPTNEFKYEGNSYYLQTPTLLPATVTFICNTSGPIPIPEGAVFESAVEIVGLISAVAVEAGVEGMEYESDVKLRNRFSSSYVVSGTGQVGAIYENLSKLGIEFLSVIENDTDEEVDGQPPGTVQVVARGGVSSDIAKVIYRSKGAGIRTFGNTTMVLADSKGYPKYVNFTRPTDINTYVRVSIKRLSGSYNSEIARIPNLIASYINELGIGSALIWSELIKVLAEDVGNISIKALELSLDGIDYSPEDLEVNVVSKLICDVSGVEVYEL